MKKTSYGNKVLYRMCRERPTHTVDEVIAGKIWLIGRAYSASIERKAGAHIIDGENFYLTRVAPMIRESGIDAWLDSIKGIKRITLDNYEGVLSVHKQFTDLLREISGTEKRSLASKYLHFHHPSSFFIFDSIANRKIRALLPRARFKMPTGYDSNYAGFVRRCIAYRDTVFEKKLKRKSSPRELDAYLLGY